MSLIGFPDLDRPIAFASGRIYAAFGGGAFRLEPLRCAVADSADEPVDFQLELVRAFSDSDSHATLSLTIGPEYAAGEALARVRDIDPRATISPCVLTDWWVRLAPTPALRIPPELEAPVLLASNGLGSARLMARLSTDSGLMLEAMLQERTPLAAMAGARLEGVSPRVPVVVRFDSAALLQELLALADGAGELSRSAMVAYFGRDPSTLPLSIDGTAGADSAARFAETMADRVIARFGRYTVAPAPERGPTVALSRQSSAASITWALLQPVLAYRHVVLPVDLLSAARAQAQRLGLDSVVQRRTLAVLPPLGQSRVTAMCNLPASRGGVDALGVNLVFPPCPPARPQARSAAATFEPPEDIAHMDVMLSPGEPLRYRYSPFAVITDDSGTRQLDAPEAEGSGSPLRLAPGQFPVDLVLVEVTPALGELAIVSGVCSYELDGRSHQRSFTLGSGQASIGLAVPRERASMRIDCVALARDGSGTLAMGPFESLQVRLDLTSFPTYGPQQAQVRCVFDDGAAMRALSFLPNGLEESDEAVTTVSFTPAEPERTFRWFAPSPFRPGFRYRSFDAQGGAWAQGPRGPEALVVYSSRLRRQEALREVAAKSGKAMRESLPRRPGKRTESAPVTEAAVDAIATSPQADPTDELLYTSLADAAKKLYVPRYALDVQTVSGQQRYRLSMSQGDVSSTLQVHLVAAAPASLGDAARDAREYPHALTIVLEFLVAPPAGAVKSLEFTDVTRNGAIVTASLTFATLQERDEVYRALTEPERRARLVVRRFIDVAVPQGPSGTPPGKGGRFILPQRPILTLMNPVLMATLAVNPPAAPTGTVAAASAVTATALASSRFAMVSRRTESSPVAALAGSRLALADAASTVVLRRPAHPFVKSLPVPKLAFTGQHDEPGLTRLRLAIENWADFPDEFFAASPDLPPCGANKAASRTWIDILDADTKARLHGFCALGSAKQMADLWFAVAAGHAAPKQVRARLTDRRANVVRESSAVAISRPAPATPVYRAVRQQLDQAVVPEPFAFPPALHGYMFQGLVPAAGGSQLVRHRCQWRGTFHTYLQDATRPSVVYCFADRFKVARRRDAPFTPFITVRVASRPDATDADVVFDYVVAPYTDAKRLEDARAQLLADPHFGAAQVRFQPFLSSDVRYFIDRPSETGAVREQRSDAALVLQGALKDTLTMPLGDFRRLFDAMNRRSASMFVGRVEIDVPGGDTQVIPFEARMDDLEGEIFSYEAAAAQDGSVQVTLRSLIESPVDVQTLDATMARDGRSARGLVEGPLPREGLMPGEALQVLVRPETALPGSTPAELAFDLGGVTVRPDIEAIWNSILDRSTVEYFRLVTVRAVASLFEPVAGREDARIAGILVEFEGGGTAELNAATLSVQVRVDHPLDDVVLGRPVSSRYRYTVTVLRANGAQERDPQPREQSAELFYVSVVR